MPTPEQIAQQLEASFRQVQEERMQGIPLLNPHLEVQAIGFQVGEQGILGALITPWFLNLVLLPPGDAPLQGLPIGQRREVELPARRVPFRINHLDGIGPCLTHSLFSPVHCFHDQAAAVAAATAALAELATAAEPIPLNEQEAAIDRYLRKEALFEPPAVERALPAEAESGNPMEQAAAPDNDAEARRLSRRELLFGALRGRPVEG
jgi:[NiFe] hydrogenase assembly HybE family chaperone